MHSGKEMSGGIRVNPDESEISSARRVMHVFLKLDFPGRRAMRGFTPNPELLFCQPHKKVTKKKSPRLKAEASPSGTHTYVHNQPGLSPHQSWTSSHRLAKCQSMGKSLFPFYKERKRLAMASGLPSTNRRFHRSER